MELCWGGTPPFSGALPNAREDLYHLPLDSSRARARSKIADTLTSTILGPIQGGPVSWAPGIVLQSLGAHERPEQASTRAKHYT